MVWRIDATTAGETVLRLAATIGSGFLLTAIIALVETAEQPIVGASPQAVWSFVIEAGTRLLVFGLAWAFFALAIEGRLNPIATVAAVGFAAMLITALGLVLDQIFLIGAPRSLLGSEARISHFLWLNAFFGGLYVASFVSVRSALRSRGVLARVRLARDQSQAMIEEVRLEAFRGQLQPKTILDAICAIRYLYRQNPSAADTLVDDLVSFLRLAVRSLKNEQSTFPAELELARQYLHLRAMISGGVGEISVDPRPPPFMSFPVGLIMPMIEQLCLAGGKLSLITGWTANIYRVYLRAEGVAPGVLSARLLQRAEMLTVVAGPAITSVLADGGTSFAWTLRITSGRNNCQSEFQPMET